MCVGFQRIWRIFLVQPRAELLISQDKTWMVWHLDSSWYFCMMLRSAVGMTHVLRSGLVMDYATSYFPLIVLGNHLDSNRSYGVLSDTLPVPAYGSTWVVLWLLFFPLRSLINGPPIGIRFRESLGIRLHSEIDQIHLSIEAQCVTTLLPLGDCHTELTKWPNPVTQPLK